MDWKKCEPIFNEQERYKLVRAIKWVDDVVENVPYQTKIEILDKFGCDICMHGAYMRISKICSTEKIAQDCTSLPKIVSPYTCGNTKYYLNTMRISQFSGGAVNLEPKPTDKIIYCPGNFDLFHIGHVDFLEQASKLGDYLIVGLYADKLAHFEAGEMGTVLRLEERMLSVLACRVSFTRISFIGKLMCFADSITSQ
ncbi:hypothetical protein Ciccas_008201 [Cichlidogyrus casuarinus]|uniref:ethanolamine-phosphate cytidylyltransferase n=1 Tax=Cichlidogyrus casuarinus TaxID=1844966 RepID=A0ABD2Q392_9PLAT